MDARPGIAPPTDWVDRSITHPRTHSADPGPDERSRRRRLVGTVALVVAAVGVSLGAIAVVDGVSDEDGPDGASASSTTVEEYRDLVVRQLERRAAEPRPVERSALPPRHLDAETFPTVLVDRERIVLGGPPPDGIASIDDPTFEGAGRVDWVDDREPVLVLRLDGVTRIYPLQVMLWHEIVNDRIGDQPITVTYCPLCNSAVAFDAVVDGRALDFGTSGALYQSAMVMYDRQTESLWTHFDGRAVVGDLVGAELSMVPVQILPWADAVEAHPDADVLARPDPDAIRYGVNPYDAYGSGDEPLAGFFAGDVDDRLAPMTRVVGLRDGDLTVAVPIEELADRGVLALEGEDRPLTVWHRPDSPWAIGDRDVGAATDTGATAVFDARLDGERLTFRRVGEDIVDERTGSRWNLFGTALDGPLAGSQLEPLIHLDTFWFAWVSYQPGTTVHGR